MYVRIVSRENDPTSARRTGEAAARLVGVATALTIATFLAGCERTAPARTTPLADEPPPAFRNVDGSTAYVGDSACVACHAAETSTYRQHAMSRSFHRWTPDVRVETALDSAIEHRPTGFLYEVVERDGRLYQVEYLPGSEGRRIHELERRIDYVMGSGAVARTYFTEENGRLFQLPLTWYRRHGWDFSPGYQINNARFDRSLPDRCIACHSSYPRALPHLEGKYAELRPGIGCERCHGPGALHVQERAQSTRPDTGIDLTIVNPARLPLGRRMDVCEQCHVHTTVSVLREGKDAFSFVPSETLSDQWAFFRVSGSIDIVSHADRLRQSACFVATRSTPKPLECATCHNPHAPPPAAEQRNQPCQTCHTPDALAGRLTRSASLADHAPSADCVSCHMPTVAERGVPHGTFTDHWIRVSSRTRAAPAARPPGDEPIEPFFARDTNGPNAATYRGMGGITYATLATDPRALATAAGALERVVARDTTHGDALFLLGVAYEQLGKPSDAIRVLERAVRADSNHPDRLRALAHAYQQAGRSSRDIEPLYRRALSLQPALAWIRADYADFLHAQGRHENAVTEYRAAVAEQPSLGTAWFNLGTVLAESGQLEQASDAFRRAVQLDPAAGQALSPLIEVRTRNGAVVGAQPLASPLPSLPVRDRGPRAVQLSVVNDASGTRVRLVNVPPRALVQILDPDGGVVRTLPTTDAWALNWDLRTDAGLLVAGGLYRVRVQGRDPTGRPFAPHQFYFGIVRKDGQ